MKLREGMQEEYENFVLLQDDPYSSRIVSYADEWAQLMEKSIENDSELTIKIVDETSHDADTDEITGFMHDMALQTIIHFWEYGEELELLLDTRDASVIIFEIGVE